MITIKHQTAFQTTTVFKAHGKRKPMNIYVTLTFARTKKVSREDKVTKRTISSVQNIHVESDSCNGPYDPLW